MNRLAINVIGNELEDAAAFCRAEGIGIEITDFAFPWVLDEDLGCGIEWHLGALIGVNPISSHGPFFDLNVASRDKAIVSVARDLHLKALTAAGAVNASYYFAHASFNPLIKDPAYPKR
jgi:hypothetical protein